MKAITLNVKLTDNEAWQLAQFVKRITFSAVKDHAENDENAHTMLYALDQIKGALAQQGYAPQ